MSPREPVHTALFQSIHNTLRAIVNDYSYQDLCIETSPKTMRTNAIKNALEATFLLAVLNACQEIPQRQERPVAQPTPIERFQGNAIYHWRTVFELDETEKEFLKKHSVKRMYVRYFDVDLESSPINGSTEIIPVGTTVFKSGKPDEVEIAPAVFITVKALASIDDCEAGVDDLASKIITRVRNMSDYNDMGPIHEIQLDCDWTASTKDLYYSLCKKVSELAHADSMLVSSTIRLHQLKTDPPPVDLGVLMVYNTGALRETRAKNSILDYDDVSSYLAGRQIRYGIPLDFAYPTYGWGVLFRNGGYNGILHRTDYSDESLYRKKKDGTFIVKKEHMLDGRLLWEGDVIRMEYPTADEVKRVADLVVSSVMDTTHNVILYHLDSDNLSNFTDDEISDIYGY